MEIKYKLIKSRSQGYAMFKLSDYSTKFWQQITKWYRYEGNLKRFNPEVANEPCYYDITD